MPTPDAVCLATPDVSAVTLPFPLIVKPSREDASTGISSQSVVHDRAELGRQVAAVIARYHQPALVERYIEGREIYVSMLGPPATAASICCRCTRSTSRRCRPAGRASSRSRRSGRRPRPNTAARSRCAARGLPAEVAARIATVARAAFAAMELRDYGRLDVRLAADGTPFVIDVNPNCDLSEDAGGFARAGRAAGLGYDEVIRRIVDLAFQRRTHADTIPLAVRPRASSSTSSRRERDSAPRRSTCAIELLDAALAPSDQEQGRQDNDGYEARVAVDGRRRDRVLGYACFGATPMTEAAYDLYWLVVAEARAAAASAARCSPPSRTS